MIAPVTPHGALKIIHASYGAKSDGIAEDVTDAVTGMLSNNVLSLTVTTTLSEEIRRCSRSNNCA